MCNVFKTKKLTVSWKMQTVFAKSMGNQNNFSNSELTDFHTHKKRIICDRLSIKRYVRWDRRHYTFIFAIRNSLASLM